MVNVRRVLTDAMRFGTACVKFGSRKWYNPLRYILGKHYQKRVDIRKVFK